MPWAQVNPVLDLSVRKLCIRRYPGHPRGCPNYGKRPTCPPEAPLLGDVLDLTKVVWAIWNRFNLAEHVARMRRAHHGWTKRQLRNCLYWQGTARRQLRGDVHAFLTGHRSFSPEQVIYCPEACGVNVTATMASVGIELEWPPENVTCQVALLGVPV